MVRTALFAMAVIAVTVTSSAAGTASSHVKGTSPWTGLTAPGSPPFHLKAVTEESDGAAKTQIEIYWVGPLQWRRTIRGEGFSQTMIVNQGKTFEEDSSDYFPLGLRAVMGALVHPQSYTGGLRVRYAHFRNFAGKSVPWLVYASPQYGNGWKARIAELTVLHNPDKQLFSMPKQTPREQQILVKSLGEEDFLALSEHKQQIIWPQVLDGPVTGTAQFYVSIDWTGAVREVYPIRIDNERAYESACRQIMRWKFKPATRDGIPTQAQSVLSFSMNTRAWGPGDPLSDEEARKLASNMVEPVFSRGARAGAVCTMRAAIDSDGQLIEVIGSSEPPGLSGPCYEAIKKWHFNPILENGEPRPYRAEIRFVVR